MSTVKEAVDVEVPVHTAYNQWTQFEEFPKFMEGVESVEQLDDTHLRWVAEVGGERREWQAEIVDQAPDRLLRRVAEELRRRRVPARHSLIGIHDDDGDRADLDERLQLGQPAAGIRELGRVVALRRHRSTSR